MQSMNKRDIGFLEACRGALSFLLRSSLVSPHPIKRIKRPVEFSPDFLPTEGNIWNRLNTFHLIEVKCLPRPSSDPVLALELEAAGSCVCVHVCAHIDM